MYADKLIKELDYFFNNFNEQDVVAFSNLIAKYKDSQVFVSGVGKSENFAKHMSDMFKSLGIASYILNPTNLLHGDMGCIKKEDIIILISKSGSSTELLNIQAYLKDIYSVGIFCNKDAKLGKYCNNIFILPKMEEMDSNLNLVPTTSLIGYHIFLSLVIRHLFDILNMTKLDYGKNHPSGYIGKQLFSTIEDNLIMDCPSIKYSADIELYTLYDLMTTHRIGLVTILREDNSIFGIVTDGDIRKMINKKKNLEIKIDEIVNTKPVIITAPIHLLVADIDIDWKHQFYPATDNSNKFIGLFQKF